MPDYIMISDSNDNENKLQIIPGFASFKYCFETFRHIDGSTRSRSEARRGEAELWRGEARRGGLFKYEYEARRGEVKPSRGEARRGDKMLLRFGLWYFRLEIVWIITSTAHKTTCISSESVRISFIDRQFKRKNIYALPSKKLDENTHYFHSFSFFDVFSLISYFQDQWKQWCLSPHIIK